MMLWMYEIVGSLFGYANMSTAGENSGEN